MGQSQSRDLNFLNMQVSKLNAIRGRRVTVMGWGGGGGWSQERPGNSHEDIHPCPQVQDCVLVARSCLTLRDPMDCGSPGSTVHGILQARTLEWAATASSRGLPGPGLNTALLYCGQILHCWTTGKLSGTGKAEHYHQMLEKPAWAQQLRKTS